MITRRTAVTLAVAMVATRAGAQPAFPARTITIIAPFTPGTPADLAARRLAGGLAEAFGGSVVVENRAGAGGTTGSEHVARAAPDGYTLLAGTQSTHAINVGLYRNLPYHPTRNFVPISRISAAPNVVTVAAGLNVTTMQGLVALAKEREAARRPLTFGSGGSGTTAHLGAEVLKQVAGIEMTHIPYRGTSQAMTDVLGGRVDLMFAPIAVAQPHILSGRVRGLAITSARRSPLLPEVPTVKEAGLPEAEIEVWIGLFAPAGTPAPVVAALHEATGRALRMTAIRDGFAQEGSDMVFDPTPAEFSRFVEAEIERWTTVVRQSGATVD